MAPFHSLIRFESAIDGQTYFADVGIGGIESAHPGLQLEGYVSIEGLIARNGGEPVTVGKILAPVPQTGIPLYCIGLNYKSHAEEAKVGWLIPHSESRSRRGGLMIQPALTHPDIFKQSEGFGISTRLNGQVVQEAKFAEDLVWKPAELLSWMSRSTTIPAGTAVMTGTPAGVGIFKQPRRLLRDGDIVEVEVPTLGTLRNKIIFE
ncbi:hypothetical protein FALCPG4_018086 [Fusarium falciforme]